MNISNFSINSKCYISKNKEIEEEITQHFILVALNISYAQSLQHEEFSINDI